jgi:hypothetical protein
MNLKSAFMDHVYWQDLYAKMPAILHCDIAYLTYLGN